MALTRRLRRTSRTKTLLSAPAPVKYFSLQTGDLPIRQSVSQGSGFVQQMNTVLPGVSTFVTNLRNVQQARPQITEYPKISDILGSMVVSVLHGKSAPQAALDSAAKQVNAALSAGS